MSCRRCTRLIHVLLVGALLLAVLPLQLLPAPGPQRARATGSAPLSYVYDDLGRLEAVTDPAGDTAIYHYDADGNVTGITRQSSSSLALIDFSPKRGTVGSSVTLSGTAFSPTASDDSVQFNGTAATVTNATTTQLVVSIPSAATSGPLTVTVGTNSVTSSASYSVITSQTPTVASFSPTFASPGAVLTVAGSNFDPTITNDRFYINGIAAMLSSVTTTSLSATVPGGATSGHLTIETPNGNGVSTNDLFIPPPGYTPSQIQVTSQMAIGDSQAVAISTAGDDGMVLFDGIQGHRITMNLTSCTIANVSVTIYNPDGSQLTSTTVGTGGGFIDTHTLPTTGTYDIFIQPNSGYTGSITLQLYDVPPDVTENIPTDGTATTVTTTTPGQNAQLTFSETAGHAISLNITNVTFNDSYQEFYLSITNPDGTTLVQPIQDDLGSLYLDKTTLKQTGTYTILINPEQAGTGSATLQLYDVPPDVTAPIAPGGSAVTVTTTTPGQNAQLTFTETAGDTISLNITNVTFSTYAEEFYLSITNPDGTTLVKPTLGDLGSFFLDKTTLPQTGTYTVLVDPSQAGTGSATLQLYDVPPDVTAPITTDGTATTVTATTPGQNAQLTFSETAGHAISLNITNATFSTYAEEFYLSITNPDGTTLVKPSLSTFGSFFLDKTTLPQTGTYTVLVDPSQAGTGSATLQLYDVPPDVTSGLVVSGPAVTVTTTTPGQNAQLTFSGTSGQQVTTSVTHASFSTYAEEFYLSITNPDGTTLVKPTLGDLGSLTVGPTTLSQTGTYTILVDPYQAGVGSATVALTQPSANVPAVQVMSAAAYQAASPNAGSPATSAPHTSSSSTGGTATASSSSETTSDEWIPGPTNINGNWLSGLPPSHWQNQPPLRAKPGITALAGQVLLIGGQPLARVTLRLGNQTTTTDHTGRFLLTNIPDGHQVLTIDGASASRPGHQYGRFDAGVNIQPGQTTILGYTIWLERLDEAHTTHFASPTTGEVVLTTPRIPGLEVHLPAGSVIKDPNGKVVTSMGITAIPVDRPPFPLPPNTQVPIYFTVQPGGSTIGPTGAYIVYPNYTHAAPGTRVDFWHYDPVDEGWFIYGHGTVTPNGKQVMPNSDTRLYAFTGAMINVRGYIPPATGPAPGGSAQSGDPIDLGTGLYVLNHTDLVEPDILPLALTRVYRPGDNQSRPFGIGTTFLYDMFLWSAQQYQQADLILPDGGRVHYVRTSSGTGYADAVFASSSTPTIFYNSTIAWNGDGWNLTLSDGSVYVFGENEPLQAIRDRYGNQITISHSNGQGGNVTQVRSPNGRWISFTYDSSNRITQATDNAGRTVTYTYDSGGRLQTVTDPNGGVTTYTYDGGNRLLTITDATGTTYLTNQYDANGRVTQQTQADGSTYHFSYTLDSNGNVTQTTVTDPNGTVRQVAFNSAGYPVSDTVGVGTAQAQTVTYTRNATSNLITATTDALGRETTYTYDANGNVIAVTRLAGTANAVTTTMTYNPRYDELASVTDPLNHTTTFGYDGQGNLTSVADPLGHTTTLTYNGAGQPTSVTDPLNGTTNFGYDHGDLVSVTDPLGRTSTRFVDTGGRVVASTDPLGYITRATYDALNQLLTVTDPLGGVTHYAYDLNGNLTSLTDPLGHTTSYSYNNMDRLTSQTDPLGHVTSYSYDANGNLTGLTDPKGQTTTASYDALGRPQVVTFADGSTDSYTFDAANRLTQVADSLSGTITAGYDGLNDLTSETTPQGSISYGYDAAGRETSMTVAGQPGESYSYDAANRLTQIAQGSATVSFSYDNAGRQTSLILPNGIVESYGYDAANQLTSLTYTNGQTQLGDLSYGYDLAGQVTTEGGSYARTGLPAPVTSATYNAANELTQWGPASLSYDADGNLTGDGTNSYSWNARNQLAGISGGSTASFGYDAFGRRTTTTISGTTTNALYDGTNLIQELVSGTPTVNYLTGFAANQTFSRTDSSGTSDYLTDALGSTIALTDSTGAVQTSYTYDPFGNPSVSGAASSNTRQYAGMPNDGTGLAYDQARYYDPSLQRFISPDPLGFGGGSLNLYSYVNNSPTNYTDPSGTGPIAQCVVGGSLNAALGWGMSAFSGRKYTWKRGLGDFATGCVMGVVDPAALGGEIGDAAGVVERGLGGAGDAGEAATSGAEGEAASAGGLGNISGGAATPEQVLHGAENWLGSGYREIAPGVYRSADDLRQFRMTGGDLTDIRQGAHVHFESISPDGRTIIENSHVTVSSP